MRDIILTIFVFGTIPFILRQPYIGALMWAWLSIMNPHRFTYGFAYSFPWAAIIAGVTMLALLISREPKRFPWTPPTILLLVFILWLNIATFFAWVPDLAYMKWERTMKIQIMMIVTLLLITNRERLHQLVWVIVGSLAFFGVKGGLFTIATGGNYMVWGPEDSFIEGNTSIGLALIMTMPLMRYLQLNTENKWVQRGLVGAMILTAFAFIGSYSRGSFLAAGVMVLFLWLKSRNKWLLGLTIALVIPLVLTFMPAKYFERMDTIGEYQQDASAEGRINAWHFAFNVAKESPITGGGFNVFTKELFKIYAPNPDDHHDAHSIYFEVLGEQGFVGLAIFLAMWFATWRTGSWIIRQTKRRADLKWASDLASMAQVSIIGYAIGGAFLGLAYFDLPYYLMAMLVILHVIVARELQGLPDPALAPRRRKVGAAKPAHTASVR